MSDVLPINFSICQRNIRKRPLLGRGRRQAGGELVFELLAFNRRRAVVECLLPGFFGLILAIEIPVDIAEMVLDLPVTVRLQFLT